MATRNGFRSLKPFPVPSRFADSSIRAKLSRNSGMRRTGAFEPTKVFLKSLKSDRVHRGVTMNRKAWVMTGLLLATPLATGCCMRDRPLFSRLRARGSMPEQNPNSTPYGSPYYFGGGQSQPAGIPCATPVAPCPCESVPGGVIPGVMMPDGGGFVPGPTMPPLQMQPPAPPAQPGNAQPMPAGPSDGSADRFAKAGWRGGVQNRKVISRDGFGGNEGPGHDDRGFRTHGRFGRGWLSIGAYGDACGCMAVGSKLGCG